ncbi:MAG TPA: hypothetical protein GXX47_03185 [Firmicutes bacterium]|nr:hypothetical protein [Bacillota bacterium]
MKVTSTGSILAVIAEDKTVAGGGAPIFYVSSPEEKERLARYISRITQGMVHDLTNGVYIIVRH